ncbi:hypothetical protein BJ878DRAFT_477489 [Calycina marina]|uniref:Uncharacterized protein n=1 Tax=Calycina marina TaxID=1763456 RepID=A0A9P7Z8E6_9HELO|nr:hypothetical protein BJ878DRAFT_477489 [Calycina marina]
MRFFLAGLLATGAIAAHSLNRQHPQRHAESVNLAERTIVAAGGWSLMTEIDGGCPAQTATCFSNLTGVYDSFNRTGTPGIFRRGEECCPYGTTPRLDCGTYVNDGQPYACCPIGNADCRGDVEDPAREGNESCANTGWALWQIPDGNYNMFCCLPDKYGYWYPALGQDAVGQCTANGTLPADTEPAIQFNNGDGSVGANGTQITALPVPDPVPAPTCDVVHYGWSLQVDDESGCTNGSNYCSYGGSCCPSGLTCGTVIGDSEVPVCCQPGNPDCRGDVEGLSPQLCADSSWALWHVNTNGNHFCCLPEQIGYNIPNDNAAVGFCGSAVPNGAMRSILDYVGDGSIAGSFANFPCNTSPAPNSTWTDIISSILNPAPTLNPSGTTVGAGIPLATGMYSNGSISSYVPNPAIATIVKPWYQTAYVCPSGATETLQIIHTLDSSGTPVQFTKTVGAPGETGTPTVPAISRGSGFAAFPTSGSGGNGSESSGLEAFPTSNSSGNGSESSGWKSSTATAPIRVLFTGGAQRLSGVSALLLGICLVYMI